MQVGWPSTFMIFGLAGMIYAALTIFTLPPEGASQHYHHHLQQQQQQRDDRAQHVKQQQHQQQEGSAPAAAAAVAAAVDDDRPGQAGQAGRRRLSRGVLAHLLMLCFTHSTISWAFFILQSWIPTFFHSLGAFSNLEAVGVLSALPWLVSQQACH